MKNCLNITTDESNIIGLLKCSYQHHHDTQITPTERHHDTQITPTERLHDATMTMGQI